MAIVNSNPTQFQLNANGFRIVKTLRIHSGNYKEALDIRDRLWINANIALIQVLILSTWKYYLVHPSTCAKHWHQSFKPINWSHFLYFTFLILLHCYKLLLCEYCIV